MNKFYSFLKQQLIVTLLLFNTLIYSQNYPSFGFEKTVAINGLTFDAMEPFISHDGNYLFFNNLNDGINTKLFYSTRIDDTTFNFEGELNGANQLNPPHLDAVPDMDSLNNFYWTSTRDYPSKFDNLHRGVFNLNQVINVSRVHGDFYIYSPGWLIMDHGISSDGQFLYFNNARFDGVCQGPCETRLGIAKKVNDSTFNTIANSSGILQNINDTNFIYYAPCITDDDLELYYTRFLRDTITANTQVEVCVAVRSTTTGSFSSPVVLFSSDVANIVEAPTLTKDKQIMYYHKKVAGSHKILMRYREPSTGLNQEDAQTLKVSLYPNPTKNELLIMGISFPEYNISVYDASSREVLNIRGNDSDFSLDVSLLEHGLYFLKIQFNQYIIHKRFIVE